MPPLLMLDIEDQSKGNGAVGQKATEVFTQGGRTVDRINTFILTRSTLMPASSAFLWESIEGFNKHTSTPSLLSGLLKSGSLSQGESGVYSGICVSKMI